jgi:hypothetical protein
LDFLKILSTTLAASALPVAKHAHLPIIATAAPLASAFPKVSVSLHAQVLPGINS